MAIITATAVTTYAPKISASAATITSSGLIPIVQERICMMTNNYFVTDLYLQDCYTFNATGRTIISVGGNSFDEKNFLAGDDIYVYRSYRNDGVYTLESVSGSTLTLISGSSVIDELSGRSILISVVKWPLPVVQVAAKMIYFDYDIRDKVSANIKSHSLGPFSESYTDGERDEWGYPMKITNLLSDYRIARMM